MEGSGNNSSSLGINPKVFYFFAWVISIILVGYISFSFGKKSDTNISVAPTPVPTIEPTPIPTVQQTVQVIEQQPVPAVDLDSICDKTGPSQKSEYLVPYTIKEGDSLAAIAEKQLGNTARTNEIIQLNSTLNNLSVGAIIYLPPPSITQSSGKILEVSGRIVRKDNASWQLSYGGGINGPGILIPSFWFKDIPNKDSYQLGDCVTVLLDDGVEVFTVRKNQS